MYRLSSNSGVVRIADGANIPDDERNFDRQQYQAWLDEGNIPEPAPAPDFGAQKAAELTDFRTKREAYLNRVAGIGFAAREAGDSDTVAAAIAVRQGLLDLPSHPSVAGATDIADLRLAIKTQYAAIVGAVPAAAKAAFKKVDS